MKQCGVQCLGGFPLTSCSVGFPKGHLCIAGVCACTHLHVLSACCSCILVLGVAVPWACRFPHQLLCFIILFFSQTDNFFTPHQRRLSPAERHLSALSSPPSIFPSPVMSFLSFPSYVFHLQFNCISSLVQKLESALWKKNKHPFFCVDCISLLCPVFSFLISVYWFKVCFFSTISWLTCLLCPVLHCSLWTEPSCLRPMLQFSSVTGGTIED